ncbi:ATP-dependent DNA helicase mph1, partial [Zancudomyces culisetae]
MDDESDIEFDIDDDDILKAVQKIDSGGGSANASLRNSNQVEKLSEGLGRNGDFGASRQNYGTAKSENSWYRQTDAQTINSHNGVYDSNVHPINAQNREIEATQRNPNATNFGIGYRGETERTFKENGAKGVTSLNNRILGSKNSHTGYSNTSKDVTSGFFSKRVKTNETKINSPQPAKTQSVAAFFNRFNATSNVQNTKESDKGKNSRESKEANRAKNVVDSIDISSEGYEEICESIDWEGIENNLEGKKIQQAPMFDRTDTSNNSSLNTPSNTAGKTGVNLGTTRRFSTKVSMTEEMGEIPEINEYGEIEEGHVYDSKNVLNYLYPIPEGKEARGYQVAAVKNCIKENTLVGLPTGVGKTFIAVVMMGNYSRWFPNGLIIFMAPSRPLVTQQAAACAPMLWLLMQQPAVNTEELQQQVKKSDITLGMENVERQSKQKKQKKQIPGEVLRVESGIYEMTGAMGAKKRQEKWATARVVFATPQTVQNDLKTGVLGTKDIDRITMLVVDEAHRTRGGYAYGMCMDDLIRKQSMKQSVGGKMIGAFRVIALTATPGVDVGGAQAVIDRLHLSGSYIRTEQSLEVLPYLHSKTTKEVNVTLPGWYEDIVGLLEVVARRSMLKLSQELGVMAMVKDVKRTVPYYVMMHTQRWMAHLPNSRNKARSSMVWNESMLAIKLLQAMQMLLTQSITSATRLINELRAEVEQMKQAQDAYISNKSKIDCVDSVEFRRLEDCCALIVGSRLNHIGTPASFLTLKEEYGMNSTLKGLINKLPKEGKVYAHPKLEALTNVIKTHLTDHKNRVVGDNNPQGENGGDTKIIVFTQFRDSVDEILQCLKLFEPEIRAVGFVGQSKGTNSTTNGTNSSSVNAFGDGLDETQQSLCEMDADP